MKIKLSLKNLAFVLAVIVLIAGFGYAYWQNQPQPPELITHQDVQFSAEVMKTFEQRVTLTKAAIKAQESTGKRVDLNLYLALASDYYVSGDLAGAAATYKDYLTTKNTIDYTSWSNYGDTLEQMGDLIGAEQAYLKAIELSPTQDFYLRYIEFLEGHFKATRGEEIKAKLEEALDAVGQRAWILAKLGDWYLAAGDCDQALEHYDVAKHLEPDNQGIELQIQDIQAQCAEKQK